MPGESQFKAPTLPPSPASFRNYPDSLKDHVISPESHQNVSYGTPWDLPIKAERLQDRRSRQHCCRHHPLHPGGRLGHRVQVSVSRANGLGRPERAVPASPLMMHDSQQSHMPALPPSNGPLKPLPLSPRLKTIGRCEWHVQPSGPSH